ncbi:disintegrin and metalloproteinase domain-containing protein 20-like isoform X2 [Equus caballus]|uniref:disintegrin and metalloproteinase domain-containing protein 20-like isoform X2 n=1 Tax=Equus caballus TaxID=9796 RepID=UPI0038B3D1B2
MTDAAMNIHIQVFMGSFLGLELLGHTAPSLMGPSWAQAHKTGDLWLPLLWLFLSPVCCSHARPGWRFTSSEVVIPRKVSHRVSGAEIQGQLSYKIHFRGQRHVVHLKVKKSLLPRHFPVITDDDQGAMQEDYPYVPRDCYYYSYLEGVPGSMGTLDTCYGGLRGMLQVDDFTYEIKPLEASSKFEHVISLLVSEERSEVERCTIEEEDKDHAYEEATLAETPRAAPVYLWWPHRKYLKLHYTVTNSLYVLDRNQTRIVENVVLMNNIVDTIFRQAHYDVSIRVMCIWTHSDQIQLHTWPSAYAALSHFGIWKLQWWGHIRHDTSLLLTGHKLSGVTYYGIHNGICNPNWGVAYTFVGNYHVFLGAAIEAHTLCHVLGTGHDTSGCSCFRRASCVMAPQPGLLDMMSNCTYNRMLQRARGWDPCLGVKNTAYTNFPYVAPRCGDKIINMDEECDCGSLKACSMDKCCETHCALSSGSICSIGPCCIGCRYAQPGKVCRDTPGICDLPEFCNGKTHACPDDLYIQDGTPCSPLAVCVRGNCTDRDMQCQALFGHQVKDAAEVCYTKLNLIGDRFGNCGVRLIRGGSTSVPCEEDDIFCGMLHCTAVSQIPGGGEHTTFRHIIADNEKCFGYDVHDGAEIPEMGLVVDGATCGPGKYCLNQNCTFYQDINFDCDIKRCNFKGVCNNRKQCHCMDGWKPPSCEERGAGGSLDSGPPPDKTLRLQPKIIFALNEGIALLLIRFTLFGISILGGMCSKLEETLEKRTEEKTVEEGRQQPQHK